MAEENGKSRFILPNADYDLNDPNFMSFIKRMMKREGLTQEQAIEKFKNKVIKHNKEKGNPGWSEYKKGGSVKKNKNYKKVNSRAIAKKHFKGIF
jgi:hypothetical protein